MATFGRQESAVLKFHRFSIGFGKVIWRRTDKLGTEFAIFSYSAWWLCQKCLTGRNEEVPAELKIAGHLKANLSLNVLL